MKKGLHLLYRFDPEDEKTSFDKVCRSLSQNQTEIGFQYRVFLVKEAVALRQLKKISTEKVRRESRGRLGDHLREAVEKTEK